MKAALNAELFDSSKGRAVTPTPVSAPALLCPAATETSAAMALVRQDSRNLQLQVQAQL